MTFPQRPSITENLQGIHNSQEDAQTRIIGIGESMASLSEVVQRVLTELDALKTTETVVSGDVQNIVNITEAIHREVKQLCEAIDFANDVLRDNNTRQANILGCIIDPMVAVANKVETVLTMLGTLHQIGRDHTCPLSKDTEALTSREFHRHLEALALLEPKITVLINANMNEKGLKVDGDKPNSFYLFMSDIPKAIRGIILNSLALFLLLAIPIFIVWMTKLPSILLNRAAASEELDNIRKEKEEMRRELDQLKKNQQTHPTK